MAQAVSSTEVQHPLAALTGGEIAAAVALVQADPTFTEATRFAYIGLVEPTKDAGAGVGTGTARRPARCGSCSWPGPKPTSSRWWHSSPPARSRPPRSRACGPACSSRSRSPPSWRCRRTPSGNRPCGRRGIEDLETVQIDPWPAGSFGFAHEEGRRICRCLFYVRHTPEDNGYAHPIEGVVAFVDMARGEVLEIIDTGRRPRPDRVRQLLPRVHCASRRPEADRDHPARRAELLGRRQPRPLAEVVTAGVDGLGRGAHPPRGGLRGRRTHPSHPLPGLGHRDGGSLRGPGPDARLEERLRRR